MKRRILVTYDVSSTHVPTTVEYILAFKEFLEADVEYQHVLSNAIPNVDLSKYDAVIHNYCARLILDGYVSDHYISAMERYNGVKVLAVQDEYNNTNRLKANIARMKFDVVLTCVPENDIEKIYPRDEFPNTRFMSSFTGYARAASQAPFPPTPVAERPIAIGYRGRDLGGYYGRLGFEKYEIGRRMREICEARGIQHDIAVDETSRIYGDAWPRFVGSCRAMLGSQSGSNIFDFDGELEAKFKAMEEASGRRPSYEEFRPFVEHLETHLSMGQVSPRVFECALHKTPMILFRGSYSGVVEPVRHYIPLEKDFSNIDDVFDCLSDFPGLQTMADRTYSEIIESGKFSYRAFVTRIDDAIKEVAHRKNYRPEPDSMQFPPSAAGIVFSPTAEPETARAIIDRLREATLPAAFAEIRSIALSELERSALFRQDVEATKHYLWSPIAKWKLKRAMLELTSREVELKTACEAGWEPDDSAARVNQAIISMGQSMTDAAAVLQANHVLNNTQSIFHRAAVFTYSVRSRFRLR